MKFHAGIVNGAEIDKILQKDKQIGKVDKVFLESKKNINTCLDFEDFKEIMGKVID